MSDPHSGTPRRTAFSAAAKACAQAQQAALFETLLPRLAIDLTSPAPENLAALFPPAPAQTRLESDSARRTSDRAGTAHPEAGFIGCEPFVNGMGKALVAIDAHRLTNIRLHFGDAIDLLDWLPDGALAGVDLLYPDPWPKKRHWKRASCRTKPSRLARVLRPDGLFRFASDIPDYAAWTLERLLRSPDFSWTATPLTTGGCRGRWVETRYEAKAMREAAHRPT